MLAGFATPEQAAKFWNAVCIEEGIPEQQASSFAGSACRKARLGLRGRSYAPLPANSPSKPQEGSFGLLANSQKSRETAWAIFAGLLQT